MNAVRGTEWSWGVGVGGEDSDPHLYKVFGAFFGLSEDPGPHAVFFSCVRRARRGWVIQGVTVVVGLGGGTLECRGETLEWEGRPLEWEGGPLEWEGEDPRMEGEDPRMGWGRP